MECGDCTLCCELLPIKSINKPANQMCKYCESGCTIHSNKPFDCKTFECAYYESTNVPIKLRPDNCKVIFEKKTDQVFIGTLDARYELTEIATNQIKSFLSQGYSVILSATDFRKPMIFIASGHNEEEIYTQWRTMEPT